MQQGLVAFSEFHHSEGADLFAAAKAVLWHMLEQVRGKLPQATNRNEILKRASARLNRASILPNQASTSPNRHPLARLGRPLARPRSQSDRLGRPLLCIDKHAAVWWRL